MKKILLLTAIFFLGLSVEVLALSSEEDVTLHGNGSDEAIIAQAQSRQVTIDNFDEAIRRSTERSLQIAQEAVSASKKAAAAANMANKAANKNAALVTEYRTDRGKLVTNIEANTNAMDGLKTSISTLETSIGGLENSTFRWGIGIVCVLAFISAGLAFLYRKANHIEAKIDAMPGEIITDVAAIMGTNSVPIKVGNLGVFDYYFERREEGDGDIFVTLKVDEKNPSQGVYLTRDMKTLIRDAKTVLRRHFLSHQYDGEGEFNAAQRAVIEGAISNGTLKER